VDPVNSTIGNQSFIHEREGLNHVGFTVEVVARSAVTVLAVARLSRGNYQAAENKRNGDDCKLLNFVIHSFLLDF